MHRTVPLTEHYLVQIVRSVGLQQLHAGYMCRSGTADHGWVGITCTKELLLLPHLCIYWFTFTLAYAQKAFLIYFSEGWLFRNQGVNAKCVHCYGDVVGPTQQTELDTRTLMRTTFVIFKSMYTCYLPTCLPMYPSIIYFKNQEFKMLPLIQNQHYRVHSSFLLFYVLTASSDNENLSPLSIIYLFIGLILSYSTTLTKPSVLKK